MFCDGDELARRVVVVDLEDVGGTTVRRPACNGGYSRIRLWDEGDRNEQESARRTDVALCADTT